MKELSIGITVIFFAVVPIVLIWAIVKATRRIRENMVRLATDLGLQLDPLEPAKGWLAQPQRVVGHIRGKAVLIHTYTTGAGKSRHTWTALVVTPNLKGDLTFSLSRQGFGVRVLQLFGAKEITVGNREFDDTWFVQTNEPEFLRVALLPELQQKFRPFRGTFKLENSAVAYVEEGAIQNDERRLRFVQAADLVCDLANVAEVHARHDDKG